jgi:hypothetical protein
MATNEDRLKKLSERFSTKPSDPTPEQQTSTPAKKEVARRRHSLYLDNALVGLCDQAYKQAAHELYPTEISKSDFLEACLKFALQHQDEIKKSLTQG